MSFFNRFKKAHVGSAYAPTAEHATRITANFGMRCPVDKWEELKNRLSGHAGVKYFRWQREKDAANADGKEHYQILVVTWQAMDIATFRGKTATQDGRGYCTWAAKPGQTNKEMADYCWKDDQVVRGEDGEIEDRGEHGQAPLWRSARGERSNTSFSNAAVVRGHAMNIAADTSIPLSLAADIIEAGGFNKAQMAPYTRQMKDMRALAQQSKKITPPEDMKVLVFYGAPGSGKSASASYNAQFHYGPQGFAELQAAQGGGKIWFCNVGNQATLLMNDVGHNKNLDLTVLLNLLDPQHVNKVWETKGAQTRVKFDRIIITSNYHPNDWFPRADAFQKGALLRRITKTVFFTGKQDALGRKLYDSRGQLVPQIYDIPSDRFIPDGMERLKATMAGQDVRDGFVVNETDELAAKLVGREPVKLEKFIHDACTRLGIAAKPLGQVKRKAVEVEEEDVPASSIDIDQSDDDNFPASSASGGNSDVEADACPATLATPFDDDDNSTLITSQEIEEMRKARLLTFKDLMGKRN